MGLLTETNLLQIAISTPVFPFVLLELRRRVGWPVIDNIHLPVVRSWPAAGSVPGSPSIIFTHTISFNMNACFCRAYQWLLSSFVTETSLRFITLVIVVRLLYCRFLLLRWLVFSCLVATVCWWFVRLTRPKKSSKIPLQAFKGGAPFCLLSAHVPPAALPQRVASGWANPSWRGPSQGLSMSACRWSVSSKRPPLGGVGRDFCVVALLRLPL